ncbi:hypothetical protein MBLNU459_g5183t1 [Dothideomycetes sp. NU459]
MSTSRTPATAPSDLTADQKQAHDEIQSVASSAFGDVFVYKRDDGALVGPFAPMLQTPGVTRPFLHIVTELGKLPGLPPNARETAILATGSYFQAVYEIYAHERVAVANTDLNQEQVDMIKNGKKPDGLDDQCSVAFDVAIQLSRTPGPLSGEHWDKAEKVLGKQGTLALIHYVGYYAYTCILLNGCDVPVPDGEKIK